MAFRIACVIALLCVASNTPICSTVFAHDEKICPICYWPVGHPCCDACREVAPDGYPTDRNVRREMIACDEIDSAMKQLTLEDNPTSRASLAKSGMQLAKEVLSGEFEETTKKNATTLLLRCLGLKALAGDQASRTQLAQYGSEELTSDNKNHSLACVSLIQAWVADSKCAFGVIDKSAERLAARHRENDDVKNFFFRLFHQLEVDERYNDAIKIVELIEKHWQTDMASAKNRLRMYGGELKIHGETPQGQNVKTEQFRGKVVVIQFWATWCGPCRKELKHLTELKKGKMGKEFELIGVSLDSDRDALLRYMNPQKPIGKQLINATVSVDSQTQPVDGYLGVTSIPTLMFLDRRGRLRRIVYVGDNVEAIIRSLSDEK